MELSFELAGLTPLHSSCQIKCEKICVLLYFWNYSGAWSPVYGMDEWERDENVVPFLYQLSGSALLNTSSISLFFFRQVIIYSYNLGWPSLIFCLVMPAMYVHIWYVTNMGNN
jgi:hypothetical protein